MGCLLKAKENSSHIMDFGIDSSIKDLKDKYPGIIKILVGIFNFGSSMDESYLKRKQCA